MIESRLQLGSCATGKRQLVENTDSRSRVNQVAGLFNFLLRDQDLTRQHQRLRLVPALGKAAVDEQLIDASFHRIKRFD
jgi:hypothetical protein